MDSLLKALIAIPVCSLILLPAYFLGAKILKVKKVSVGAAFLLLLITGSIVQVFALFIPSFASLTSGWFAYVLDLVPYVVITGIVFGYFVQRENGGSIGPGKGMLLSLALWVFGGLTLPLLGAIFVGAQSVLP